MSYDKVVDSSALDTGLTSIADAIRTKGNTSAQLAFPSGFVSAIGAISSNPSPPTKEWVRPSNWPDLDSLDLSNEDAMYYTVDCRSTIAAHAIDPDVEHEIGFCADTTGGTWTLERGKIENGTFAVTETCVAGRNSGAVYNTILPITEGDFVVYRMRASGDAAEGMGLKLVETASSSHEQPVVEIYGRLPWASGNVVRGWGYREFASRITEHVKVIFPGTSTVTSLQSMFYSCSSLQSIDMSGWDTTGWAVTSLQSMFYSCSSLQSIDMSGWDTTGWAVTSLQYMFSNCYSLQALKFGLDTIWPALSTQINTTSKLRHNSIVAFFGVLPAVSTTLVLTLGSANLARVSDAEKSVATNKGWTLA
ncbi:BspA family leucine-rich repeat surface protein [Paratractidigestivibacter sp.]|uniref:BspA family leucine-rich repeat surface protein n=1 Tax=Paratractidigestivibacter sp. TaxID=2847316 RepID=UPI002ACB0EDA|nr:BspA family leucine-rich repeat surface protein [Paratractidigestivibacter sp.]